MLMPLYCKKDSYICYAHAYWRNECYAYGWSGRFSSGFQFSPTFDERLDHVSEKFLKGPYNPNQNQYFWTEKKKLLIKSYVLYFFQVHKLLGFGIQHLESIVKKEASVTH